jgi:hypothetical protein
MDDIIKEAIEIELHPNNMNRKGIFCLSTSWKPLIHSLRDHRKPPDHFNDPSSPRGYLCPHMLNSPS